MKYIIIFSISIYQFFLSPLLKTLLGQNVMCRFSPTCSQFAKQQIQKHGIIRGGYLAIVRIMSCQPFSKSKVQNEKFIKG